MKLVFFSQINIAEELSQAYRDSIIPRNLEVEKNRHIQSRIIEYIQFCNAFELALRCHNEASSSDNPGVVIDLVNVTAALDSVLSQYLEAAAVFRGASKNYPE